MLARHPYVFVYKSAAVSIVFFTERRTFFSEHLKKKHPYVTYGIFDSTHSYR